MLKAPPVFRIRPMVATTKAKRGTMATTAAGRTPGAGFSSVAELLTRGTAPSRRTWPDLALRSAFNMGPKSRPVQTKRPTKKIVNRQ